MSCQKGNACRSRPQRYQNHTSFKNNLYDNSHKIKQINSIKVTDVCKRCKKIIEWKIKYKKYKALKAPMKCTKCEQKTVKYSYHNICLPCSKQQEVCPKCGQKKEIVEGKPSKEEQIKLDAEFKVILKTMSERKRRAFLRYMNQQSTRNKENNSKPHTSELDINTDETGTKDKNQDETNSKRKEDLLMKLKSLAIIEDDDNIDSDTDNEREDDNFDMTVRMEGKEKPGILSCMIKGPGPVYKLPTLVGYSGHDPSRHRNPAYSIRPRTDIKTYVIGPGPHYDVRNLTKSGLDNPPAYTIRGREAWSLRDRAPGPGAYSPELCSPMNHSRRAPAYSIKSRGVTKFLDEGPGPNSYLLPTCIGPKVPDKTAQSAFSIVGHRKTDEEIVGPGPAAYTKINYDMIKRRSPAYSLKGRHILAERYRSPAPIFYPLYDTRKRSPMYSFGIKHSECVGIPMTQLDED